MVMEVNLRLRVRSGFVWAGSLLLLEPHVNNYDDAHGSVGTQDLNHEDTNHSSSILISSL